LRNQDAALVEKNAPSPTQAVELTNLARIDRLVVDEESGVRRRRSISFPKSPTDGSSSFIKDTMVAGSPGGLSETVAELLVITLAMWKTEKASPLSRIYPFLLGRMSHHADGDDRVVGCVGGGDDGAVVRKRPCCACGLWFFAVAHVGARQRACSKPGCHAERRRERKRYGEPVTRILYESS